LPYSQLFPMASTLSGVDCMAPSLQ
jgi:hypothetical protein